VGYVPLEKGEKEIIITTEQISENAHKYPKLQKGMEHLEHRPYVADRFMAEHGCIVIDFKKLKYLQSRCQTAILVRGKIGTSLSAPRA
jgi:hypothetical protein